MTTRFMLLLSLMGVVALGLSRHACAQDAGLSEASAPASEEPLDRLFEFPREWFYNGDNDAHWENMNRHVGKSVAAMTFRVRDWTGVDPTHGSISPESMGGRIVVLEFWQTGNPLSVSAIPHLNSVLEEYGPQGVEVIGITSERGGERADKLIESEGIRYVTARDTFRATAGSFGLLWHPWTVVVDRNGIIRAAGLRPEYLDEAIEMMLEKQPASAELTPKTRRVRVVAPGEEAEEGESVAVVTKPFESIPQEWLEASFNRYELLKPMIDRPAPSLEVETWRNSFARRLVEERGNVVLLFFFATDDPRCLAMARLLNTLHHEKKDEGLVIIGVSDRNTADRITEYLNEHTIDFPVCIDPFRATINKYQVDGFPDVYAIGKRGLLRGADLKGPFIDDAAEMLLAETP